MTIAEAPGPPIITTTAADITAASGLSIARQTVTPIHQYRMQQQLIIFNDNNNKEKKTKNKKKLKK